MCKQFRDDSKDISCLIERGFGNEDDQESSWSWEKFSNRDEGEKEPDIYLYKMHGSIDWDRDQKRKLIHKAITHIATPEIIFGTRQKVKHYDPFLFFIYEFREYALKAKIIIVSGYGFWDEHINDILKQGLDANSEKILLVNIFEGDEGEKKNFIKEQLKLEEGSQIRIHIGKASEFFRTQLKIDNLDAYFYKEELPF